MAEYPVLETERLRLRPFALNDAPDVKRLAGHKDVASMTLNIPHPYEDGMAEEWIGSHQEGFDKGEIVVFAIVHRDEGFLIGAIGLTVRKQHSRAEMGYWIGKPYWNHGYCTEAARAVLRYGFEVLGLNRIHASHFARNPASGRVMQKIGMTREGCFRQHVKKWDRFEDLEVCSILGSEYRASRPAASGSR